MAVKYSVVKRGATKKIQRLTLIVDSGRLEALGALELHPSERCRINGYARVPFAFQLDRFVFADNFTPKFERATLVGYFDELWRLTWT